jgi:hypothetical protein
MYGLLRDLAQFAALRPTRPRGLMTMPPGTVSYVNPHKDRSLPGKKRRLARKAARRG